MWTVAVTHDAVATIRQLYVLPHGDEGVGFGNQHLSQHSAGTFACKFSQWIVDGVRLAEGNDSAIYRHGVSLLSGRFWQAWTPASIRRLQSIVVTQIPP
jgi:hypothetical protein